MPLVANNAKMSAHPNLHLKTSAPEIVLRQELAKFRGPNGTVTLSIVSRMAMRYCAMACEGAGRGRGHPEGGWRKNSAEWLRKERWGKF